MGFHRTRHVSSVSWHFDIVITQNMKMHPSAAVWLLMGKRSMDVEVEGESEPTEPMQPTEPTSRPVGLGRAWVVVGVLWLFFQLLYESSNF